ncbi:hypothetical protein ACFQGT_15995 [Natrialbaceae archaeon GCM10025810]|uniref:DUF5789 family protein n=1 Tax=Halovalidus salilacus TaxID=3075124 RepID=UPI00361F63F1
MASTITMSGLEKTLERLGYPIEKDRAATELENTTLEFADGEANLGRLVSQVDAEAFDSANDLETSLHNVLPREAVGEPYQSEGEG